MNENVKRRWVEALRSGKYIQTTGALRAARGHGSYEHCCLGVLCELAAEEGIVETAGSWGYLDPKQRKDVANGMFLPDSVKDWAGLPDIDPVIEIATDRVVTLTQLNDTAKISFEEIAAFIEEYL